MRQQMSLRIIFAAMILFVACGTLRAQAPAPVSDLRIEPNPTTIDVAAVLRGQFVVTNLDTLSSTVTRAGNSITVEHVIAFIGVGVPPPPLPFGISLGVLPEGVYTVLYQARTTEGVPYAVRNLQLVVLGGAQLSVPTLSVPSAVLLVVLTLALGLWGFRRYR